MDLKGQTNLIPTANEVNGAERLQEFTLFVVSKYFKGRSTKRTKIYTYKHANKKRDALSS